MHRTRPRAGLAGLLAAAGILTACSSGASVKETQDDRDCTAVTQAAAGIQLVDAAHASESDATRTDEAATRLTQAAASVTTAVAGPAGELAAAARSYADALAQHNGEQVNVTGGLLRQRAQPVADVCKAVVLGVAPTTATNGPGTLNHRAVPHRVDEGISTRAQPPAHPDRAAGRDS